MTELDIEATSFFLGQRLKYAKSFDDKKTNKTSLWSKIAKELNDNGYTVGEGKEGAEKCRQKFANLQRQYISHRDHMKRTGENTKDPPAFFDEMHGILGAKHKVDPEYVLDSSNISAPSSEVESQESIEANNEDTQIENVSSPESVESLPKSGNVTPTSIRNRFSAVKKTCKPVTDNAVSLTKLLDDQFKADLAQREQHFQRLDELLSVQNNQRDRMLKQFDEIITLIKDKKNKDPQEEA
ncbi:hypothetical protein PPYR_15236 [Photinus pyralis]|nr:hypothetical protein PPYR_15236 [Photinus pyralis]